MSDQELSLQDLKDALRRRWLGFLICASLVGLAAIIIALALPPIYRAKTVILIEAQQIPPEYIRTTVTSYIDERLKIITQQVMSRTKLMEIINQFKLYTDLTGQYTTDEIIDKMREDITFTTISADVTGKKADKGDSATVAFMVAYAGSNPTTVQRVTNALAALYLQENTRTREARAAGATEFLEKERRNIKTEIDALEQRISDFKAAHAGELPEFALINNQTLNNLRRDLDHVNSQFNMLQERIVYLQGQLSGVTPAAQVPVSGGRAATGPAERLKTLRMQLTSLRVTHSDKHPDVIRIMNEIKQLEDQLAAGGGSAGAASGYRMQENPAYISLKTQLDSSKLELANLNTEKARIVEKIELYEKRIQVAPVVEKDYNNLVRSYDMAKLRYRELTNKLMEARSAQDLEDAQKGERFVIVEPATVPQKPYKPNRLAILLVGCVLALGTGAGFAFLREMFDHSIKNQTELVAQTGLNLLTTIRFIESFEELRAKRRRKIIIACTASVFIVVCLIAVHVFYTPLDILWIRVQKRLMLGV
ncbi:MAG: Wzz/FepE/Etk N-terminal domain-containing protein [Thermodesulfobacteriota bacterium]